MSPFILDLLKMNPVELVFFVAIVVPTIYVMLIGAPFVPTDMRQVDRMLKIAKLKPGMKVYDLGSGDGRLVHSAAKRYGVEAVGIEFSPLVYLWGLFLKPFWQSKARLRFGNFWNQDLRDADVIFCYLLPSLMDKIESKLVPKLSPGTLVVSHAFTFKTLQPVEKLPRLPDEKLGPVWVYKIAEEKSTPKSRKPRTQALPPAKKNQRKES